MRKKRVLSFLLAVCMVIPMLTVSGLAAGTAGEAYTAHSIASDYFYKQLNDRAKAIYTKLLTEFEKGEEYYDGTRFIDLIDVKYSEDAAEGKTGSIITEDDINNYKAGNKDIFNDFCAAKDALDLDHSELWWIDSGYLSFQVTQEDGQYHVLIGPGRGKTYLLAGGTIDGLPAKIADTNSAVDAIVNEAVRALNEAEEKAETRFSDQDRAAFLTSSAHDQIVKKIHYRYETECRTGSAPYIRTLYGIVTHEGVCEAYARTLQVCLTKLGVQCVLVHGVQTKGTPEDHMWNAVNIPEGEEDHWYVVDATWDDPLTADWSGKRDLTFNNGEDGKETNTYLLVGQSLVGEHWRPSGYVSTGNFEFKYPTIETAAYAGATVFGDDNGLKVKYSTGGTMEDAPAGVYTVTFKGWNAKEAAKHGFYFMIKMYDYHPDGTADVMDEWYYVDASFALASQNDYFGDFEDGLRVSSATCEYVEVAVTTLQPYGIETWHNPAESNELSKNFNVGYFQGDESQIVAQSGMLYNVNSKYEAPPYVLTQFPAPNGNCTAGYNYRFDVVFDDELKHPLSAEPAAMAASESFANDTAVAASQAVRVRYTTIQQDLHTGGEKYVQIAGELPFDINRDGYVDMPNDGTNNDKVNFLWKYKYDGHWSECPNHDNHPNGVCDVNSGCAIVGVEFNFRASDQWIDDITEYNFSIEGVVGSRSSKFPNNFSVISCIPGLCPACYRSQGIDWNLWGQPTLLDAPENLDLASLASAENDSEEARKALEEFNKDIHRDEMNGRLMLVVEDKSKGAGSREDYERINGALTGEGGELAGEDIAFSSIFEINFNRVCPMVKLQPNKGQSLRVQVGYPAGITYESLKDYDLKAFHFVRCSNDPDYYCDEVKDALASASDWEKANILKEHAWGEHIIKTEQITLIPTPYGIIIMCDAFSPFEIVALKKDETAAAAAVAEEVKHNVIVVAGENGKVMVEGVEAVGQNGNKEVNDGGTLTFTVDPADGYVVNTVSFGGETDCIKGENGTYTLTNVTRTDVLNVTFIPEEVKAAEQENYGDAVEAKVCTHTQTKEVPEDGKTKTEPTCTQPGYAPAVVCTECGQTLTPAHEIPATGHTPATEKDGASLYQAGKLADCVNGGRNALVKCTKCEAVLSDGAETSPVGHIFTKYEEGERTCQGVTLTAKCDRAGCQVIDTKVNPDGAIEHDFDTTPTKTEATCTQNATNTYKCKWCTQTKVEEIPDTATGHVPDENGTGLCKVCKTYICDAEGHKLVQTEAAAPDCTTPGHTAGTKCEVCGVWTELEEIIPALGHDFQGHTAGTKCSRCDQVLQSDQHTEVDIEKVEPTCDEQGSEGGKKCSQCGQITVQPTIIPALGHQWSADVQWNWSTEGELSASVTRTCERDHTHTETVAAKVELVKVTTEPTCTDTGLATYKATATLDDGTTLTNEKTDVVVPTVDHVRSEEPISTTPPTCTRHGTETYECTLCHEQYVETLDDELLPHEIFPDHANSKPATCTEAGEAVGVCEMCLMEQREEIPALGHDFGGYRTVTEATCTETGLMRASCSRCGAATSYTTPALGHTFENGECTRCGVPEVERPTHPVVNTYEGFEDVPAGEWYEEYLRFAVERNLILGTSTGRFSPQENLTRVQWMILLARFDFQKAGWSEDDVNGESMAWAVEKGITDGTDPQGAITREQLVTMLWRYFDCPESDTDLSAYDDFAEIDDYALPAFQWAVGKGIIQGVSPTELAPRSTALRCQAAAIFTRVVKDFEQ